MQYRIIADTHDLAMGHEKLNLTLGGNLADWRLNNANSNLFLATNGGATKVIRHHGGYTTEDGLGNGQEAWKALKEEI